MKRLPIVAYICIGTGTTYAFTPPVRLLHTSATRLHVIQTPNNSLPNDEHRVRVAQIPKQLYSIYVSYLKRLWKETDKVERERIAADKSLNAVKTLQQLLVEDEYLAIEGLGEATEDTRSLARHQLLDACKSFLTNFQQVNTRYQSLIVDGEQKGDTERSPIPSKVAVKKKPRRSILFGAVMGAVVAAWVFSGNYIFTGLFTLMTILGQLEYYRMVMNTGVYPARKISIVGACSMFLTVRLKDYLSVLYPLHGGLILRSLSDSRHCSPLNCIRYAYQLLGRMP